MNYSKSKSKPETACMHGTACAPGYPSDSTRSLARVGSQDGLRAAARTLTTLAAAGRPRASAYTTGPRSWRGRSRCDLHLRAATFVCDSATFDTTPGAPILRPRMVPQVRRRPATHSPPSATTHGPPCGQGLCSMASKHLWYVGGSTPPTRYSYRIFPQNPHIFPQNARFFRKFIETLWTNLRYIRSDVSHVGPRPILS